ncbi:MAG: GatB/YqeY domain-containing protein [Desulfobacterales bacterium]
MSLQEKIHADLKTAMKEKQEDRKEAIRVILGEFARSEQKVLSDEEVVRVLRKLQKSEREVMEKRGVQEPSAYLRVIESYLPEMADESEIRDWIAANVDFSVYKNKMQAMGQIMKHFGSRADGNEVRRILQQGF